MTSTPLDRKIPNFILAFNKISDKKNKYSASLLAPKSPFPDYRVAYLQKKGFFSLPPFMKNCQNACLNTINPSIISCLRIYNLSINHKSLAPNYDFIYRY